MAGQLNEHPLAELIREISAAALSGALRLSRERAKISVYFEAGDVVFAGSNLRTYRLSECMLRWRVLNEAQIAQGRDTKSDPEFGDFVVKAGMLGRDTLNELLAKQVSEILCHALLWIDGTWDFDPRVRVSTEVWVTIKTPELLIEAARRLPPELPATRFRSTNEMILPGETPPEHFQLLPTEAFVLTRVDIPLRLHELIAISGLPDSETKRVAYALTLGGFLKRDQWPVSLTEEEVTKARAVIATSAKRVASSDTVSPKSAQQSKAASPVDVVKDEKEELEALFTRLRLSTNYYQMLGLVRPITDTDVKRAYHSLAKRYHPDRFRKTVDDELHSRIESAFVKIAQAYETLKDKQLRAAYDSTLLTRVDTRHTQEVAQPRNRPVADSTKTGPSATSRDASPSGSNKTPPAPTAEEQFQQGIAALENGNAPLAITLLGEAARLEPSQPRYRAYYGRALAGQERLQRSAEAELKAAVALDAKNLTYRVMLAELYIAIGLPRRAQGELRRVLSIDPNHGAAQRLLRTLS